MAKGKKSPASGGKNSKKGGGESSQSSTAFIIGALAVVLFFVYRKFAGSDSGKTPPPTQPGPANDLIRQGLQNEHVDLRVFSHDFADTGRGLAAARDFAEGDMVMQVPLLESAYIGKHNLPLTFSFHQNKAGLLEGSQGAKQALAIAVMIERQKKDSKWASFFECLPAEINNLAVFKEHHRRAVNQSDVGKKFEHFDEMLKATLTFVKAAKTLFDVQPTEKEVRWAIAMVESRAHMHENGEERILWPYLILGNHHYDTSKALKYVTIQGRPNLVHLVTQHPLKKGDQVFFHYGSHGNLRLLIQYGFAIPNNPQIEPTPINLVKQAGADLFKFGTRLLPKGPACRDMAEQAQTTLKRRTDDDMGLPSLLVRCWRQMQFQKEEDAAAAIDAGMLDEKWNEEWIPKVEKEWLVKDAAIFDTIGEACKEQREVYTAEPGGALWELKDRTDSLSRDLREGLNKEVDSWNRCVSVAEARAATIRKFLSS